MSWSTAIWSVGGSLLFLIVAFVPLERAFPAKRGQCFFRPGFWLDMCFFIGQYVLWGTLVFAVVNFFGDQLANLLPKVVTDTFRLQPIWLQVLEVIFFSDLCIYWGHRLQHHNAFLWRFHKVHHTAEHLDWLAAHREHPLDSIYTIGLINLPALLLGFPFELIAGIIAFRGIWAIYIHSNVRLPIGPIKMLIGAPELHHWHHSLERDAGNYANISPLMDLLFGTYICPDKEPDALGIKEKSPRTYLGLLVEPIVPSSLWKYLSKAEEIKPTELVNTKTERST